MKWLVDMGNTRCKSAYYDGKEVSFCACVKTHPTLARFRDLFVADVGIAESVWVASVADRGLEQTFADRVRNELHISVHFVRVATAKTVLKTVYDPTQLGVDRFVCLPTATIPLSRRPSIRYPANSITACGRSEKERSPIT